MSAPLYIPAAASTLPTSEVDDPMRPVARGKVSDEIKRMTGVSISRETVNRWLAAGRKGVKLSSFFIGGRRYVRLGELKAFLEATQPAD